MSKKVPMEHPERAYASPIRIETIDLLRPG